ncbi:4'-phosphopantetheinyl transferase family protein [Oceanospirillum sediminis]|uniref:Enterobactin synthase component D n=1 Tax=Oceanospirillum sediminis TaxID=2760088 RepID=A0A839IMP0_9GAMM|nr:4'-phosphopantetheinyl transferase superfamily protein [Oceanospirillum sediminis]MBB1485769.1 4'-phosphopantetheinyl transferase superfamily protein [Oceanospirillum sediminis]
MLTSSAFYYRLYPSTFSANSSVIALYEADFIVSEISADTFAEHGISLPERFENMVAKRRCEYLVSRLCARQALEEIGCTQNTDIRNNTDRSPVWPDGFTGSFTHTTTRAAACVTRSDHIRSAGLDIEPVVSSELYRNLYQEVLTPGDIALSARVTGEKLTTEAFFTLVFSAKETLFKAIYKDVGYIFGFEAATVTDIKQDTLTIKLNQTLSELWPEGSLIHIRYMFRGDCVYTLLLIGAVKDDGHC